MNVVQVIILVLGFCIGKAFGHEWLGLGLAALLILVLIFTFIMKGVKDGRY